MGALDEYLAAGGMHGMAAQSLYELLTTASEGHPLAEVAALMRATAPPSLDTWAQALEVAGEIFSSTADKPEPLASEAFEHLQRQHPPHLLALALILLADFEGMIDPPLPDTLRGPLWAHLNALQGRRLTDQMLAGGAPDLSGLETEAIGAVYMMLASRASQSAAAKSPKPRKKPTLRGEFIAAMKRARREDSTLPDFIDSVRAGSVDGGLELKDGPQGSGRYLLDAEAVDEPQKVAMQTLKDWWKAAGKG